MCLGFITRTITITITITLSAPYLTKAPAAVPNLPRARGQLRVGVRGRAAQITALRQSGSLKLLFPGYAHKQQAVIINTAGGITGGDQFEICAHADNAARLTLTTQTAERAYRALRGEVGTVKTTLRATNNATLNWLPQETILFDECALQRHLRVDLDATASLTLCEPIVFGRAAMGERLQRGLFSEGIAVHIDGTPVFCDKTRLYGDIGLQLSRPWVADGAGAMAFILHKSMQAEAHLGWVRDLLPRTAGASLLRDDLLVVRALAPDSFTLRAFLIPLLARLTAAPLPRTWMI